jgi:hypothetical protein
MYSVMPLEVVRTGPSPLTSRVSTTAAAWGVAALGSAARDPDDPHAARPTTATIATAPARATTLARRALPGEAGVRRADRRGLTRSSPGSG